MGVARGYVYVGWVWPGGNPSAIMCVSVGSIWYWGGGKPMLYVNGWGWDEGNLSVMYVQCSLDGSASCGVHMHVSR